MSTRKHNRLLGVLGLSLVILLAAQAQAGVVIVDGRTPSQNDANTNVAPDHKSLTPREQALYLFASMIFNSHAAVLAHDDSTHPPPPSGTFENTLQNTMPQPYSDEELNSDENAQAGGCNAIDPSQFATIVVALGIMARRRCRVPLWRSDAAATNMPRPPHHGPIF